MKLFVVFSGGSAIVERSKILHASSDDARRAVAAALRVRQVEEGPPSVDRDGAIIEGVIVRLKRGTTEYDRAALSKLPLAAVADA